MGKVVVPLLAAGSLCAGLLLCGPLISQEAVATKTSKPVLLPPSPPQPKPPTEVFRQLLAASPAEQERILASRSPGARALLESNLRRYEAMPADERERHLRTLELRWYLLSLMQVGASNRLARLAPLPRADRMLIANRLMYWDLLPSELQKEVLTNEMAIRIAVPSQFGVPLPFTSLTNLPPQQRQKIEADVARWKSLPTNEQQRIYWHFKQLFELPDARSLAATSATNLAARPPADQSLAAFKKLPPAEQAVYLGNFQKYLDLPPDQREQFEQGARRWQAMSEPEREQWRQAVKRRPPFPLPPPPPGYRYQAVSSSQLVPTQALSLTTNN